MRKFTAHMQAAMQVGRQSDIRMCESGRMLQGVPVLSTALILTK